MTPALRAVDQFYAEHVARPAAAALGWAQTGRLPESMSDSDWERALADAIAVAGWPPPHLLGTSGVRLVACGSAGFNAYLGQGVEQNDGLVFYNSRGTMAIPVAEHAIAQMILLATKIRRHLEQGESRDLGRLDPETYEEVTATTAVIVGLGDIGAALAQRCLGLGMRVIGERRTPDALAEHPVVGLVGHVGLDEAAGQADHWSSPLPGSPESAGLEIHTFASPLLDIANLHVACATATTDRLEVHHEMFRFGVLDNPMEIDAEGRLLCPDGPGLGIELDWDWIDDHTIELVTADPLA